MSRINTLIQHLGSGDRDLRSRVIARLVELGPEAVPALCEALHSPGFMTRLSALVALGQIGDPGAVEAVVRCLDDPEWEVHNQAIGVLGRLGGPQAQAALVRILERGVDPALGPDKLAAAVALVGIATQDAVPALAHILPWVTPELRIAIIEKLGRLGDPRATDALAAMLNWHGPESRIPAAAALGRIGGARAARALCQANAAESPEVVAARRAAILKIGHEAIPELVEALGRSETSPGAAGLAWDVLRHLGAAAVPALVEAAERGAWNVRPAAVALLGEMGDPGALTVLSGALAEGNEVVRRVAVLALPGVGPGAAPALRAALGDADPVVAARAAVGLVEVGQLEAQTVPRLVEAVGDPNRRARLRAMRALARFTRERPVSGLRAALPVLKRLLRPWSGAAPEERRAAQDAAAAIEAATAGTKDLPLPALRETDARSLPIPGEEQP